MNSPEPDTPRDPRLIDLALHMVDDEPVDWEQARHTTGDLSETLERLRQIEQVARTHRDAEVALEDAPPPAFVWGRLQVRDPLGEGAFGEVWRAWDPTLQREVALKLRRAGPAGAAASRRWLAEARALARVRHPNVLVVYGAAEHDGVAGMWTELIEGDTLEQWLAQHGPLGAREAGLVGIELCGALAAVHAAGVVHGDVKAANVLRMRAGSGAGAGPAGSAGGAGRIVLADFGSIHEPGAAGVPATTPLACAPEVLRGGEPTVRSDVWSLGALLHRLTTGQHPFEAATRAELVRAHDAGARVPLRQRRPDLPAAFVAAIERALAADPSARWAGAGEFEAALAAALELPAPRTRRAWWRSPAALVGGAAALAAVLTLALLPLRARRGGEPPPPAAPAQRAPAVAPAATTPAPTTPVPLTCEAALERVTGGATQPLGEGATIAPGDHLALTLDSAEPVFAYVLDEDQSGALYVLFPVHNSSLHNPLPAHARDRLPGRFHGAPFDWQVTSAGGEETILVVASRTALPELDRVVARTPGAAAGRTVTYATLPPAALGAIRGVGGMAPSPARSAPPGARLRALARELATAQRPGIWLRTFALFNPGS